MVSEYHKIAMRKQIHLRLSDQQAGQLETAEQVTGMNAVDILRTLIDRHLDAYVMEVAADRQKKIDEFLKGRS